MCIQGGHAVAMVEDNFAAIPCTPAGRNDDPIAGRMNCGANGCGDVDSGMKLALG